MARTSKKRQAAVPVKKDKIYSVGIYARLSVDGTDRKNESIDNQLELCREYVRSHEDMEVFDCYSDLGKTGTNFQRDDFERLMADVRMRKVDCIVVKDLSRFGRNHLEMGNYLGKIFPFLGVRFIAVNDNFDNMDGDPETLGVQLKNLVNELYAKDIAVKIRSSRVKQFERGSFSGCHPVYGYDVMKEGNRRVLVVNEEAAVVVRELFDRFLRGEGYVEMIEWLYAEKIHRPSDYRKYGHVHQRDGEELHNWHKATLNQILNNCAYIGWLICEQKDGERVTGRTSTKVLTGELKVRENNHEPIISEEVFQEVARQFEARSQKFSSGSSRNLPMEEDIYKDLIYCGLCGSKFTRECGLTNRSGGKVRNYQYRCVNKETIDDRKCDNDRISLIILNRLVEEALEKEFSLTSMKHKDLVTASKRQAENEKKKLEKEISEISYKIEELKKSGSEDYIRYRSGEMTEQAMTEAAEKRKKEIRRMQDRQKVLERRLAEIDGKTEKRNHYLRTLMKCRKGTPLTAEVLHALIEKIEVFKDKRVKVHFIYSGKEIMDLEGGGRS
ncbi:recombinase family protein [Oribacterium sp. NK2B42]|uniref:recombinase family protein n=1 Tax=Oribacterium sp. NK2B42 TaxID=689781 RepID=UPI000428D36B|nr:recombinase family protein [Oribacterium sp. NK2B42]